jgi:biopolymer transport protein ExbD
MRRKLKQRARIELNITPIIDIVFILFTFFLVSTSFKNKEAMLDIKLPSTKNYQNYKSDANSIKIILGNDKVSINENIFLYSDMENSIKKLDKKDVVEIKIDENVNYKKISELFNILKKYELNNILLVTKNKNE